MSDVEMSSAIDDSFPAHEEDVHEEAVEMSTTDSVTKQPSPVPGSDNDILLDIIRKEFEFEEFLKRHEIAGTWTDLL
jgi:hypothetical protein